MDWNTILIYMEMDINSERTKRTEWLVWIESEQRKLVNKLRHVLSFVFAYKFAKREIIEGKNKNEKEIINNFDIIRLQNLIFPISV